MTCAGARTCLTVAGNCVTPVVVRCEVTGQETFTELVDRVGGVVTEAFSDAVPFEILLSELGVPRDPRNHPAFSNHPQLSAADDLAGRGLVVAFDRN